MEDKRETLYIEIINYCNIKKEISPSIIQRKFKLGYNKAYEYYEQLQRDKIIPKEKRRKCILMVEIND